MGIFHHRGEGVVTGDTQVEVGNENIAGDQIGVLGSGADHVDAIYARTLVEVGSAWDVDGGWHKLEEERGWWGEGVAWGDDVPSPLAASLSVSPPPADSSAVAF